MTLNNMTLYINAKAKAEAYNTCIAPEVTYRDFRGADIHILC